MNIFQVHNHKTCMDYNGYTMLKFPSNLMSTFIHVPSYVLPTLHFYYIHISLFQIHFSFYFNFFLLLLFVSVNKFLFSFPFSCHSLCYTFNPCTLLCISTKTMSHIRFCRVFIFYCIQKYLDVYNHPIKILYSSKTIKIYDFYVFPNNPTHTHSSFICI